MTPSSPLSGAPGVGTLAIMAGVPLFSGLSKAQLAALESNSAVLKLDKGR